MKAFGLPREEIGYFVHGAGRGKMTQDEKRKVAWGQSFASYYGWYDVSSLCRRYMSATVGLVVAARTQSAAYNIMEMLSHISTPKTLPAFKKVIKATLNAADGPTSDVVAEHIWRIRASNSCSARAWRPWTSTRLQMPTKHPSACRNILPRRWRPWSCDQEARCLATCCSFVCPIPSLALRCRRFCLLGT
jgi:hypothetical protein